MTAGRCSKGQSLICQPLTNQGSSWSQEAPGWPQITHRTQSRLKGQRVRNKNPRCSFPFLSWQEIGQAQHVTRRPRILSASLRALTVRFPHRSTRISRHAIDDPRIWNFEIQGSPPATKIVAGKSNKQSSGKQPVVSLRAIENVRCSMIRDP